MYIKDEIAYGDEPYIEVVEIHPLEGYKLWCRLSTGEMKIYDFTPHLDDELFRFLRDKVQFDGVHINEFGALSWINPETGEYDIDIGVSWIVKHGVQASDKWGGKKDHVKEGTLSILT